MTSSLHRMLRQNKPLIAGSLLLILSAAMIPQAHAYMTRSAEAHNRFTVGYCDISLDTTDGVTVRNTGTYPCFIRVAVDNASGLDEDVWEMSGGFYYYPDAVAPGESTPDLFDDTGGTAQDTSGAGQDNAPAQDSGITVYAEAIDAVGADDALTAWTDFLSGGDGT